MNEPRSYTAQTVEVAVSKAARELGVPMDAVRYEVVFDGKGGLFGIGKREVEISALGGVAPDSPLGRALMGAAIGDVVDVEAPRGSWKARVLSIRRP